MKARRIRTPERALWRSLLEGDSRASFFLTPEYAEIVERTLGRTVVLFAFECEDGSRIAFPAFEHGGASWLRRDFVAPARGLPGGLLCDAPLTPERADAALRALAQIPNARFRLSLAPGALPELPERPERTLRRGHVWALDLAGGFDRVRCERFAQPLKARFERASRSGMRFGWAAGRAAFVEFGNLHRRGARGADPELRRPLAFFAAVARAAEASGAPIRLALARSRAHDGAALAGLLLARRGDTVHAWLGATDPSAERLGARAGVYRLAVEWACAEGARRLLLGPVASQARTGRLERALGADAIACTTALEVRGRAREWLRRTRAVAWSTRPLASA